jgi:nitrite reductase/ring-hydroxylating ferredoxin subunit
MTARFTRVCALGELVDDVPLAVKVDGEPVAVVRVEDRVLAIHDVCSHAEVALSDGEVYDTTVECWLHGSRFDLETGEPTGLPATEPVPVYPVRVEGDGPDADVLVSVNHHDQPRFQEF